MGGRSWRVAGCRGCGLGCVADGWWRADCPPLAVEGGAEAAALADAEVEGAGGAVRRLVVVEAEPERRGDVGDGPPAAWVWVVDEDEESEAGSVV